MAMTVKDDQHSLNTTKADVNKQGNAEVKAPTLDDVNRPNKKRKTGESAAPAILQQWQNKGRELRDEPPPAVSEPIPAKDQQTYAVATDNKKNCFLCLRAFESLDGVHAHLAGEMHSKILLKPEMIEKAVIRLKRQGISLDTTVKLPVSSSNDGAPAAQHAADMLEQSQYRDRAAQRRHEQAAARAPEKGGASRKRRGSSEERTNKGSKNGTASPEIEEDEVKPAFGGKGRSLLEKAGWSEGKGLGDGTGVTAPIEQNMYRAGVGLGHEASKKGDAVEEAARMTKSTNDYGEYGDEVTRARLAEISKREKEAKLD